MKNIDGSLLKQMFISGGNLLYNHYPEVDALNVFPVPDGDTGMNMNLTLTSGAKEIQNRNDKSAGEIAKAFSKGLLMGARGNSGVITSQIFRGFASGLEGIDSPTATEISNALEKGVEVAYKAVMRPVEGTILTVIRESSNALHQEVKSSWSVEKAFEYLLSEAKKSLERTPELLPILKEVGVIDSGGYGLNLIIEGMLSALKGTYIERNKATATEINPLVAAGSKMEEEEFGYCTEFILRLETNEGKKAFNEKRFSNWLLNNGNSQVVVRDEDIVKVHIHTLTPGVVLNYAQQFGEFKTLKIENMSEQHHALETGATISEEETVGEVALKKFGIIAVSSGEGIDNFFKDIGVQEIVKGGQTMNPSCEDFISAIKKVNAENVIILPNNSNIILAASQACDVMNESGLNCVVVPTKTIPQGITASIMFNAEASLDENFNNMKDAIKGVKSGSVTFAIRDSVINDVQIHKDDYIGLFDKNIVEDNKNKVDAAFNLIEKMIDDTNSIITILVGKDVSEEETNDLMRRIQLAHPDLDLDMRDGGQPVYSFLIGVE